MPLPLPQYARVKDKYCIAYFGNNKEFLVQLKLFRPIMESTFPGIQVHLACREDSLYLLKNEDRIITKDELKENKHSFGYVRELVCDMKSHPIEDFMNESGITMFVKKLNPPHGKCVLLTNGIIPVRSLNGNQIKSAITYIQSKGFHPEINGSIEDAGWIVGVENEQLYLGAASGAHTSLIPTGFGENIFKSMFLGGEILELMHN